MDEIRRAQIRKLLKQLDMPSKYVGDEEKLQQDADKTTVEDNVISKDKRTGLVRKTRKRKDINGVEVELDEDNADIPYPTGAPL